MKIIIFTKKTSLVLFMSLLYMVTFAQGKTITGKVTDANGQSMIGVTVVVQGTTSGTVTNIDGEYSIVTEAGKKLQFSFIGFIAQTIEVGTQSAINVSLVEQSTDLDEVVVVGYGTMKKSDLTGSVGSVSTEKLTEKGAPSVMENLQGTIPGVSITQSTGRTGGSFDIEIRGKSSLNSDVKPMYVVDGVICSDIQFLNPQDIERIDVLKDASSTAIYGSRATAGVIIVTTKSGSSQGSKTQSKPSISYDGYYGTAIVSRMPDFMDAQEFYNYRFLKFLTYAGGYATSGNPIYQMGSLEQCLLYNSDVQEYRLKTILAENSSYDWPSMVTQNGIQQNHYLAVSGNSEDVSYHMGIGYNQEDGTYTGDTQDRFNIKGSVDATLNEYVSSGFSFNIANIQNGYSVNSAIQYAYRMNPFMQPYDAEGNLNEKPGNYVAMGSSSSNQFSDQRSPLLYMQSENKERETYRMLGNFYINIKPMKGMSIKSTFSPNFSYYREGDYYVSVDSPTDPNTATYDASRSMSYTWDNIVNYAAKFKGIHSLNLMGLYSLTYGNSERTKLIANGVMDGSDWYNLGSGTINTEDSFYSPTSFSESSMLSYALRANYTLKDKYMMTATVRWDGSSKFAKENRWGSFPSVALAWRASEEDFLKTDWLTNLKFRLSYGITGNNAGIGNYATQQTVSDPIYYPFGSTYYTGFYPSNIVNSAISWETSEEYNFGIDYGFIDNRISGTLDIYQKTSKDLLYKVDLPYEAGGGTMTTNIGEVRNRGVELLITTVNIAKRDLRWETTFSFAANDNEIREIMGTGEDLPNSNLFIGRPIHTFRGYEWNGIISDKDMIVPDNEIAALKGLTPGTTMKEYDYYYTCYGMAEGQPIIVDRNGDGKFTDEEDGKYYTTTPKWTGSFTTNLYYKEWDLSASLYTKQNYTVSSNFMGEYLNWSDRGRERLMVDYYIPAGTIVDADGVAADGTYINPKYQESTHYGAYPFPNNGGTNGGVGTDKWLSGTNKYVDASYIKVKNITLGYTFPKSMIDKIGMQKLRLYCTVTNPFVVTSYKGFDPEWADTELSNDGPSTITYQFGASIKF
ncbi:MAG: SusC/RagA family TonB-linked outer membrane protein [Prolixibacteraceae bacterium]